MSELPDDYASHEHRHSDDTVDMVEVAHAWLADDPDDGTRRQLQDVVASGDARAMAALLAGRLHVTTDGMRGRPGPGPNRVNRVSAAKYAAAAASFLRARGLTHTLVGGDPQTPDVLVDEIVQVLAGAGLQVLRARGTVESVGVEMCVGGVDACVLVTCVEQSDGSQPELVLSLFTGDGEPLCAQDASEVDVGFATVGPLLSLARGSAAREHVVSPVEQEEDAS